MSWLNNSLNTLKGQLSNFAQEVLAEGNEGGYNSEENPYEALQESTLQKLDELNKLCADQVDEISLLRKQIADLQAKQSDIGRSSKSPIEKNASLEDSWCWEPDNVPSDTSGKNDNEATSESSIGGDMITIPLDVPSHDSDDDRSQKLKRLSLENATLNDKIRILTAENSQLNASIEELDSQHDIAMQNVLSLKNELQTKYSELETQLKVIQKERKTDTERAESVQKDHLALEKRFNSIQEAYTLYVQENEILKGKLEAMGVSIRQMECDNLDLQAGFKVKETGLHEVIEKITADKEFLERENNDLQKSLSNLKVTDSNENQSGFCKNCESFDEKLKQIELEKENVTEELLLVKEKLSDHDFMKRDFEEQINELQYQVSSLTESTKTVTVDKEKLQSDLTKVLEENKLMKKVKGQIESDFVIVEKKCADIQKKQETTQEEFQTKIDALQNEVTALNVNNQCLLGEIKVLQRYSPPGESGEDSSSSFDDDLKRKYGDLVAENDQLQADYAILEEQLMNVRKENENLETMLSNAEEENQNMKQEIEEYKTSANFQDNQLSYEVLLTEKEALENERKFLRQEIELKIVEYNEIEQKMQTLQKDFAQCNQRNIELVQENKNYKAEIADLNEKFTKCENNASDVESKLMMETVGLQKKVNDLESSINRSNMQTISESFANFKDFKELLEKYLTTETPIVDKFSLEQVLVGVRNRLQRVDMLEKNLKALSDEISQLIKDKTGVEHERNTFKADLMHYEIECSELMKNNEILLNELENYKCNKLETIPENNEESIVVLEKQLEESNNLNKTLEDEYDELNQRLHSLEMDKHELQMKANSLQDANSNLNNCMNEMKDQIDMLESEKCNLIFEINEMKTDDKKSAMESEIQEFKNKNVTLESQLERLNKDHADLVFTMQNLQQNLIDSKKESEATIAKLDKYLYEKDVALKEKEAKCQDLTVEIVTLKSILEKESLEKKLEETSSENQGLKLRVENLEKENLKLKEELNSKVEIVKPQQDSSVTLLEKLSTETQKNEKHSTESVQLNEKIEILTREKNDLIQSVTTKHNENMQYYMEIQRLNQVLQAEVEKSKNLSTDCSNCAKLSEELANISATNSIELEKLKDQINFLKEKSDILQSNLLSEQTNQKLMLTEKMEIVEQNNTLRKDLQRLREHLLEVEDAHTEDTVEMQKVLEDRDKRIELLENEVAKSGNAYTSASIRANQHAETLQAQYLLVAQQRDELIAKLNLAEDRESKNQAALVNLQCALEQFQKEKEHDIQQATSRIRKEIEVEKQNQKQLSSEINSLQQQLAEANQGLLAAARLSDQLEVCQVTIAALREEIEKLQKKNETLDEKLRNIQSSQEDRIEKSLVKSLLIGYIVSANQNDKMQILKLITSVLDFNQTENDKIGLNKNQGGWLTGILYGGNAGNAGTQSKDSLVKAFVSFLEKESQPRTNPDDLPNLLNIVIDHSTTSAGTGSQRKRSETGTNPMQSGAQPILLNESILEQFAPSRNSSSILKDILNDS